MLRNNVKMKTNVVFALMAVLVISSGCDMFRRIAGRPTSADIDAKRQEIAAADARIEALKKKQRMQADSLAIVDSIRQLETDVHTLSEIGELYSTALDHRYYIIVGSFMKYSNAESMLRTASEAGYIPVELRFNGYTAVGLSPADRIEDAFLSLKSVKRESFCPDDVWILVNR